MIGSDTVEVMQYDLLKKENMNWGVWIHFHISPQVLQRGKTCVTSDLLLWKRNVFSFKRRPNIDKDGRTASPEIIFIYFINGWMTCDFNSILVISGRWVGDNERPALNPLSYRGSCLHYKYALYIW